jgi:hypothetical protein
METQNIRSTIGTRALESRGIKKEKDALVGNIKSYGADLFDAIDNISIEPGNSEAGRLVDLAKTNVEQAVMWAVKAVSRC